MPYILLKVRKKNYRINYVVSALIDGEIIEQYPTDYPFPSCLVLGHTKAGKVLHVVCGSNGAELWLITTYIPSPVSWSEDFRQRRKA
jgi:hypothetical protein